MATAVENSVLLDVLLHPDCFHVLKRIEASKFM